MTGGIRGNRISRTFIIFGYVTGNGTPAPRDNINRKKRQGFFVKAERLLYKQRQLMEVRILPYPLQAYIDIYESTDNISAAEVMVLRLKYG